MIRIQIVKTQLPLVVLEITLSSQYHPGLGHPLILSVYLFHILFAYLCTTFIRKETCRVLNHG